MGIPIFSEICKQEFENSLEAAQLLRPKITAQEQIFVLDRQAERAIDLEIRKRRDENNKLILEDLRQRMTAEKLRGNDIAQMKGASSWLTALPLKEEGYVLNKREFFDAVAIRYAWNIKRLPINCVCGKKFNTG